MDKLIKKNKLVIIAGSSRGIGKKFLDHFTKEENTRCYGLSRSKSTNYEQIDLTNKIQAHKFVDKLTLKNIESIFYMHSIGIDKFEPDGKPHIDEDGDGIDDEIYKLNVTTFMNLAKPLIDRLKFENIPAIICNIGSISDQMNVPYWQSFSKSKNIIRRYCKSLNADNIQNLILNISSTLDSSGETYGRINADTTYWQTEQELLDKALPIIKFLPSLETKYMEIDFFKQNPNYEQDYFTNTKKLFKIWQKDMGFEYKKIPHGIRI